MRQIVGYSLFKRKRDGKPARRWSIELRFADGTTKRVTAFTDKAASNQKAANLVRDYERHSVGLIDPFEKQRKRPVAEHVADFLVSMRQGTLSRRRGKRPKEEWVTRCEKRLTALLADLEVSRIGQFDLGDAEKLLELRLRGGWSAKTRDDYAQLLRQFGTWLVDDGRLPSNPFGRLRAIGDLGNRTFERDVLTVEQLGKLIEAAEVRAVQNYAKTNPHARPETVEKIRRRGWERGLLYEVAGYSGLRRGEITAILWSDLVLGDSPAIRMRAWQTKNAQMPTILIPTWLGKRLEQHRQQRAAELGGLPQPHTTVFSCSYRHLTERMKEDAVFAEVGYWSPDRSRVLIGERVLDFHSLRGTYATLLAESGMTLKNFQEQIRHSKLEITLDVYAKSRQDQKRCEVEGLPSPRGSVPVSVDSPGTNERYWTTTNEPENPRRAGS